MTIDRETDRASTASGETAAPPDVAFEGTAELAQALFGALVHATQVPARRLWWSDPDFAAWPVGEADWLSLLTRWARLGGREIVMMANDYRAIERLHPRFVVWRRDWAHVIRCMAPDDTRPEPLPTLWLDNTGQVLKVFDREHSRGRAGFGRIDRQRAREEFDAHLQRGAPGFPAVTLGL